MTRGRAGGRRLRWAAGVRAGRVTRGGAEARREVAPTSRGRVSKARPGRGRWAGPLGGHRLPRTGGSPRPPPPRAPLRPRGASARGSFRPGNQLFFFFFSPCPKRKTRGRTRGTRWRTRGARSRPTASSAGGCSSGPSPGSLSTSRDTEGADSGSGGRPPFGSASPSLDGRPGHVQRLGLGGPPRHRWVPEARPAEPQLPL